MHVKNNVHVIVIVMITWTQQQLVCEYLNRKIDIFIHFLQITQT